jgi:hypothetical protein
MFKILLIALLLVVAIPVHSPAKPGDVVGLFVYSGLAAWAWCVPVQNNNHVYIQITASFFTLKAIGHFVSLCVER